MSGGYRKVTLITMKRKHISLTGNDRYGHWWFEIGDSMDATSESYGWWPKERVGVKATIVGVEGELNGQTTFGGERTRDPHHGDSSADQEFHPCVPDGDPRSDMQIADCLRAFAGSYHGEWRWTVGKGQNCHTFQISAMEHCGLRMRPTKSGS